MEQNLSHYLINIMNIKITSLNFSTQHIAPLRVVASALTNGRLSHKIKNKIQLTLQPFSNAILVYSFK